MKECRNSYDFLSFVKVNIVIELSFLLLVLSIPKLRHVGTNFCKFLRSMLKFGLKQRTLLRASINILSNTMLSRFLWMSELFYIFLNYLVVSTTLFVARLSAFLNWQMFFLVKIRLISCFFVSFLLIKMNV